MFGGEGDECEVSTNSRPATLLVVHSNYLIRVAGSELHCLDFSSEGCKLQSSLLWDCEARLPSSYRLRALS